MINRTLRRLDSCYLLLARIAPDDIPLGLYDSREEAEFHARRLVDAFSGDGDGGDLRKLIDTVANVVGFYNPGFEFFCAVVIEFRGGRPVDSVFYRGEDY
jgi:hypothetical protein